MRPLLFACSLLLFGFLPVISGQKCYSCASNSLKLQWELTGLPSYPKGNGSKFFDAVDCEKDPGEGTEGVECPSQACYFGTYALETGEYAVVRACVDDILGDTKLPVNTGNGQCEMAQVDMPVTVSGHAIKKPVIGWYVCKGSNTCNDVTVNEKMATDGLQFIPPNNQVPCTQLANKGDCINCAHVDGKGRCHHNSKTYCTAAYCTKLSGKLNGRWFEIRGCANVNPLGVSTCLYREKTYTIQEVGGTINQTYWSNNCICAGSRCNGASSMAALPYIFIVTFAFVLKLFAS